MTIWPTITSQTRPWTRWWWLGSAVDKRNITRQLEAFAKAGLGGVEITPIYGVQGEEARNIPYLSPQWVEMLQHAIAEAKRLGMGVDMPTCIGWPFGGPNVRDEDAIDKLALETKELADGALDVSASATASGMKVKRAAPGGEGKCINPFSRSSLEHYLERFDEALAQLTPGDLRCHFHDSFEYEGNWAPDAFVEFEKRRGYDLRDHLAALAGNGDPDTVARVSTDYRETMSDLLLENFTQTWSNWAHRNGSLSRNQAHGSPGNWLDLYGTVDIPETEIFGGPGDPRIAKFASSAAHVMGHQLSSSESCTWLREHFTVTLADCKSAIDGLFTSGINHVFYHGTPYSPDDAKWPGWLFYASTTFSPPDPIWHDFPALNTYIARIQSFLQAGEPDNDLLLYWPIHDMWHHRPNQFMLTVSGQWFTAEPVGDTAQTLLEKGYQFDYVSDRQLQLAEFANGKIKLPGSSYRAVVVPICKKMPLETVQRLFDLASAGATVIFEDTVAGDVPGYCNLDERRYELMVLRNSLRWCKIRNKGRAKVLRLRKGTILIGANVCEMLSLEEVRPEPAAAVDGVSAIRRRLADGSVVFAVNKSDRMVDQWIEPTDLFAAAVLCDPMTGAVGVAQTGASDDGAKNVRIQLAPHASVAIRFFASAIPDMPAWPYHGDNEHAVPITGTWQVDFIDGGPTLPESYATAELTSWTDQPGETYESFAGTARYTIHFDAPAGSPAGWHLRLAQIHDSARISLNGNHVTTLIAPPWTALLPALKPADNILEIEVTNVAANRIRTMDRHSETWRIFEEINLVNINYKPFDASGWPVRASGLVGTVELVSYG